MWLLQWQRAGRGITLDGTILEGTTHDRTTLEGTTHDRTIPEGTHARTILEAPLRSASPTTGFRTSIAPG